MTLGYVSGTGTLPTTASGIWLMFDRAGDKGADGLGVGDFVGPASSVADNIVTFASATGKAGKDSGVAASSLAPKANAVFTGTFTPPDATIALGKLADSAAVAVLGRSAGSAGARADISASADDTFLQRVGGVLAFGGLTIGMIGNGLITFAKLASATVATAADLKAYAASKLVAADVLLSAAAWFVMTDAATITVDHASGSNQKVTLGGNRAFGTPANAKVGMPLNIWVVQDGTGSRVPTWAAEYDFGDFGTPVLSTAANAADLVTFMCLASNKYAFLGIRKRVD